MVSDATYTVTCDKCGDEQIIEPEIHYTDYSGKTPIISLAHKSIEKEIKRQGFQFDGEDTYCAECLEVMQEENEVLNPDLTGL